MLFGLASIVDQSTADSTLVDPIVTNAAQEIADTTPQPVAVAGTTQASQPTSPTTASPSNVWLIVGLAGAVGLWWYSTNKRKLTL